MSDWVTLAAAAIPTIPAVMAVILGNHNRRQLKTPSGDPIGHVIERAHDLAAVATLANLDATRVGGSEPPPVVATDSMTASVERLNADEHSPVHVNGNGQETP